MSVLPRAIAAMAERRDLSSDEMRAVMQAIMTGAATPAQIGAFLMGLRMKGETVDEVAAAAAVMRALATGVEVPDSQYLVDTCGTGGDGRCTLNISTASAFVVAAAGGRVAKHGNRSVSSRSGSADVLEAAGVRLDLAAAEVADCIAEVGVGFLFAPQHHLAMQHALGPRREMGIRTLFNMLGPLTNPAQARRQLVGVFHPRLVRMFAEVLARLGSEHALIVHGAEGLDEISLAGPTQVAELRDGAIREFVVTPEEFGFIRAPVEALVVRDAAESLARMRALLGGEPGPAGDVVALNAGAAIYVAGLASDLAGGVHRARTLLAAGQPLARLEALAARSHSYARIQSL
ncbi:MAG TPA: anthranilate phosphoribosyltransferase [Acidiferrobacteraceae bacterium]|nr:anthranilate phosphoribosyltransferase [Acidiferrobacteraceae bacterium]